MIVQRRIAAAIEAQPHTPITVKMAAKAAYPGEELTPAKLDWQHVHSSPWFPFLASTSGAMVVTRLII